VARRVPVTRLSPLGNGPDAPRPGRRWRRGSVIVTMVAASVLAFAPPASASHHHSRAPESQTTGTTTPTSPDSSCEVVDPSTPPPVDPSLCTGFAVEWG
jgi:hypothetical protein